MDVLNKVATDCGLAALFHEKPFAGVNGNGKHTNWSLFTDDELQLVHPGTSDDAARRFMAMVACLCYAVKEHGDLLRAGIACAGNDHRLGAQEAPPAIISLYTGAHMEEHIKGIINGGKLEGYGRDASSTGRATGHKKIIHVGATMVPIEARAEDRNRTSPFPFCGNKFEFRAVGGSQNPAMAVAFLNTAMADGMKKLADAIEGGKSLRDAVATMFQENFSAIFNGNGYSEEWPKEAESRGLPNLVTTVDVVDVINSSKNKTLLGSHKVMTASELEARQNIMWDAYAQSLQVEAHAMLQMLKRGVIPACANDLKDYEGQNPIFAVLAGERLELYKQLAEETRWLDKVAHLVPEGEARAARYCLEKLKPQMEKTRAVHDKCEELIQSELYPFPNYQQL